MGHQTIPDTVPVRLPLGTWLGVSTALRNQRYELQRFLAVKTSAPEHVREATRHALREVNAALDAIESSTQFD